jgi:AhpD family alkylhydroperoxidase
MKFDNRTTELIALGASVAANCQYCVQHHLAKAKECGIEPADVAQAIQIGRAVRAGAAAAVDKVAESPLDGHAPAGACGPAEDSGWGPWRMSGCCPK